MPEILIKNLDIFFLSLKQSVEESGKLTNSFKKKISTWNKAFKKVMGNNFNNISICNRIILYNNICYNEYLMTIDA
jgi:hypothetical protein